MPLVKSISRFIIYVIKISINEDNDKHIIKFTGLCAIYLVNATIAL